MNDMKMTKTEAKNQYGAPTAVSNAPEYPYGLCIELDNTSMSKLGIDKLPDVGSSLMVLARVEVCRASESKSLDGKSYRSISLQITEMEVSKDSKNSDKAKELYG